MLLRVYCSIANCLTTVRSLLIHLKNWTKKALGHPSLFGLSWFFFPFFFLKNTCHDKGGAIILADLVYSPRACLWEHHVYCAVLSTSMECNICHDCHSKLRRQLGERSTEQRAIFQCKRNQEKEKSPRIFYFFSLNKPCQVAGPTQLKHLRLTGPYLSSTILNLKVQ